MKIPSAMVCEAHAKGFRPASKLWAEVRKSCRCTKAQFSDALSDNPSGRPSIQKIRNIAQKILDDVPEIQRETFQLKCYGAGKKIEDIYKIYLAEHPDHIICYERFRQAASEPYTVSEYRIAKAADEIIARFEGKTNEEADSKDHI